MFYSFLWNLFMLVVMMTGAGIILVTLLVGLGNMLLGEGRWRVYGVFLFLLGLAMMAAVITLLEAYSKIV